MQQACEVRIPSELKEKLKITQWDCDPPPQRLRKWQYQDLWISRCKANMKSIGGKPAQEAVGSSLCHTARAALCMPWQKAGRRFSVKS